MVEKNGGLPFNLANSKKSFSNNRLKVKQLKIKWRDSRTRH